MKSFRWLIFLTILLLLPGCSYDLRSEEKAEASGAAEVSDVAADEVDGGVMEESLFEHVDEAEDIEFTVKEDSLGEDGTTIIIRNKGDQLCTLGTYYRLEIEEDGIWYNLPYAYYEEDEVGWDDLGYEVRPRGDEFTLSVNWEWLYGELEPGRYRMVKDMFYENDWQNKYYISAEFEIEEAE